MISSCSDCTNKCCKLGPGPWKPLPFKTWYKRGFSAFGWNTKCENWDEVSGNCSIWNTDELPIECKIFVCHNRSYSDEELRNIKTLSFQMMMKPNG